MLISRNFMVSALLLLASASPAQQGGDLQAQILYAYQTEDTNSLANLIQDLAAQVKADEGGATLRYHLAHAQYRRGLLAGAGNAHEAESGFAGCIDQLKPVLSQDVKSVEALVLQSACYAGLASHRKIESVLLRSRSDARLNAALGFRETFMISAATGDGLDRLRRDLGAMMPPDPWLYPEDQIADAPMRSLAAEITREKLFERLHDELPYQATVETDSWKELPDGSMRTGLGSSASWVKGCQMAGFACDERISELIELRLKKSVTRLLLLQIESYWRDRNQVKQFVTDARRACSESEKSIDIISGAVSFARFPCANS